MSKLRPSEPIAPPEANAATGEPERVPAAWLRRVFRNTFTRQGRRYAVKGWSFKVQFQGRRRTFSLAGRTRAEAACEARELHATILTQGWDAAVQRHRAQRSAGAGWDSSARASDTAKHDLAYWRDRLIQRRYREARLVTEPEFSVRIEHDGAHAFFPLGSADPDRAAARARQISQTILANGWTAAFEQFEREFTLAIFWADNPLAVTYTTLFSFVGTTPATTAPEIVGDRMRKPIGVFEPDVTLHGCLRYWLDQQPGFACVAVWKSVAEGIAALARERGALVLFNRMAPEAAQLAEALKREHPGRPVFPYRIHEESDQIFSSISGVSGGYILRRRLPTTLFDPLHPAARLRTLSAVEAGRHIQDYFQSFFSNPSADSEPPATVTLTSREQEILNHVSRGYLDKEIAHLLNISIWTVHNHVKNIYEKLGVHNRTEAALKLLQK